MQFIALFHSNDFVILILQRNASIRNYCLQLFLFLQSESTHFFFETFKKKLKQMLEESIKIINA